MHALHDYEPRLGLAAAWLHWVEASGDRPMEGSCGVGGEQESIGMPSLYAVVACCSCAKATGFKNRKWVPECDSTPTHCAATQTLCAYLHIFFPKFGE